MLKAPLQQGGWFSGQVSGHDDPASKTGDQGRKSINHAEGRLTHITMKEKTRRQHKGEEAFLCWELVRGLGEQL